EIDRGFPATGGRHGSRMSTLVLEQRITEVQSAALERIADASTPEELEAVRVKALGRKGALAQFSKEFGNLAPDHRAEAGKALKAAKEAHESRLEAKKQAVHEEAWQARLRAEWIDLTLPAPGVRPGSLHPVTQIQMEIEDLFTSLGFAVLDG